MPSILVKKLPHAEGISLPIRATAHASGFDLCAAIDATISLEAGSRAMIPTGLCFEIPLGYEVQVRPRSGLAAKNGVTVLNTPGTIDADYRGEIKVILINLGSAPFSISRGDRIAQAVPAVVAMDIDLQEVAEISNTVRGEGGFGSTGVGGKASCAGD